MQAAVGADFQLKALYSLGRDSFTFQTLENNYLLCKVASLAIL